MGVLILGLLIATPHVDRRTPIGPARNCGRYMAAYKAKLEGARAGVKPEDQETTPPCPSGGAYSAIGSDDVICTYHGRLSEIDQTVAALERDYNSLPARFSRLLEDIGIVVKSILGIW
ncbi:MAG: hypothetical protein GX442_09985 [Candidatus Riflebacteria bacterium]|nr:hypothetical protein [Candidatus Riflebacteria bacterium]